MRWSQGGKTSSERIVALCDKIFLIQRDAEEASIPRGNSPNDRGARKDFYRGSRIRENFIDGMLLDALRTKELIPAKHSSQKVYPPRKIICMSLLRATRLSAEWYATEFNMQFVSSEARDIVFHRSAQRYTADGSRCEVK